MKKKLYTLLMAVFLFTGTVFSQDILLESFDNPAAIGNWKNSTAGSYTFGAASEHKQGAGAVALAYNLVADQGWGGSVDMQMNPSGATYGDLKGTDGISFWYKVVTPASVTAGVNWNTKLYVNSTGGQEEWHAALGSIPGDASGEWVQAKIAFSGFAIPLWLTTYDGVLYQDQVAKIEMQIVAPEGTTTAGEILVDGLTTYKDGGSNIGPLLQSFDVTGDIGNWINSTTGSYTLNSSSDAVEGTGAACLDYILIADQSWGGSVDMQFHPAGGAATYPDLTGEAGIRFNYRITQPASVTNGVNLNFKLFINSTGGPEEWHAALGNVLGDVSGEWQEGKIPFTNFSIPSWLTTHDGVLYLDSIFQIEMQVIAGTMGIETNGTACFDNLTSYSSGNVTLYDGYTLNNMDNPSTGVGAWINSTGGSFNLYASSGAVQGDSSACVDYNLVADQGWGGSVDMQFSPAGDVFPDMTGHLGISFWYKVNVPASTPGNVTFIVKTFVNSTGGEEQWHRTVGGVLADPSGEWKQVYIPFEAFAIPNWLTTFDGVLYQDQINKIQFQILGTEGTTTTGDICFDQLQSYDDEEVTVVTVTPVDASVRIYPNPTSSELKIEGLDNIEEVQVYNMSGSLVKTVKGSSTVDVASLWSGLYIMKIRTDKAAYSAKIMKQ